MIESGHQQLILILTGFLISLKDEEKAEIVVTPLGSGITSKFAATAIAKTKTLGVNNNAYFCTYRKV
jgi:hypothetical protein